MTSYPHRLCLQLLVAFLLLSLTLLQPAAPAHAGLLDGLTGTVTTTVDTLLGSTEEEEEPVESETPVSTSGYDWSD